MKNWLNSRQTVLLLGLLLSLHMPAQPIALMLDKMNVLQAGMPNPIQVVVSDLPMERLLLQVSQGELLPTNLSEGRYYWKMPQMTNKNAWMIVADSSMEHPIDTFFFRVIPLPEPRFQLTNPPYSTIGGIYSTFDGFCSDYMRPIIESFDVIVTPPDQKPIIIQNSGPRFNEAVVAHLNGFEPGTKIIFTHFTWFSGIDPTRYQSDAVLKIELK